MIKIIKNRGCGKTTELIEMANNENYYIVCPTKLHSIVILKQAKELGYNIKNPITYAEFVNGEYVGKDIDGFLIDNAELLLQQMSPFINIKAITMDKG